MKYNTENLTLKQKRDICELAHKYCFNWWADILDCSVSFRRKRIDITFEEAMKKLDETSWFYMIHRKLDPENHLEVGYRTGTSVEYFLWLQVDPKYIPELTKDLAEEPNSKRR